ncbi:glycoside hydrolase family 3 N-terminal domain-containing protein [Paenibacillus urinalis]|uniref:Glycoside hydrolase family 3 N-terminal domain-containing protein n=1 Tax=Paenibacillus urinalis TaxID=521520 RepID=A0AAX3N4I8_9BACL|nr:glycoside hydrolase family 3 N-terminal domain-containing protein [Paenibacillus urinalis]WDH83609.1 glycoside hydrolase family 3 N-terminal domain-containing protein [Paenibacillus urinalis]WDH99637.1 glycoside hydrolase family 3 N-terminal domain-containing protein [Paenibacillus urinalis]WDI03270.1 glycoside hydrolase family 3 N-terminal domain-containing protein [Paenibacillus urinalis]
MMIYKDAARSVTERTEDLLKQMTMEEKIGQLVQPFGWKVYENAEGQINLTEEFRTQVQKGGIGSLYGVLRADPWTEVTIENGLSPELGAEAVNEIQRYAIQHSRLGIPILFGEECSHGHMAIGATVFPVPLLIGSTWNTELYSEMCRAVALETRSQGGAVTYSPVLDVVRDPRWGRTEECFGEDPYLIGEFAVASVKGLQGDSLEQQNSVAATLKHFAGYGSSEGGRNAGPAHMGMRELREVDLYPFRRAVEAGAASIMPAYNEIDGTPCTSNKELLEDILRTEWGFDGMVITDCGAINMLAWGHDTAEDGLSAAVQAITAGIDMEMSGEMFAKYLGEAVETGRVDTEVLDRAVRRVLTLKFRLGLFDHPYCDPKKAREVIGSLEHKQLARQVAAEGIIMLKNKGQTLPLSRTNGVIAVIGPNADQAYNQLGDYTSPQPDGAVTTVLDGIKAKLADHPERVLYAPGCRIQGDSREGFEAALACAAQADTVVLVLGGSSARDFGEGTIDLRTGASVVTDTWNDMDCGEGIDRMTLTLSGVQLQLAQEIHKLGKKLIVIYINGRPITEPWLDEHADAILEAWYPGQEGGHAAAGILFGDVNPSGRLTVSIPKHVGQLPVHYRGKRSRGRRYLEEDSKPKYPFGYGLSYTSFTYSDLRLSASEMYIDNTVEAEVIVKNTGDCRGAEVIQLYISDAASLYTRPELELKGFRKIELEPGEERRITFAIGRRELEYVGADHKLDVEPGLFHIRIGRHVNDTLSTELTVLEG